MKRLAALGVVVLALVGCAQGTSPAKLKNGGGEWYDLTDPKTGVELRCHVITNDSSHNYKISSESCYIVKGVGNG